MKKLFRFISLLLIFSGLAVSRLSAQTFGSEAELKEQAAKLFDDDQFEEAFPLYAQLASIYNKDPNINYRLGVCMLYASDDKEKPIPFLELAAKYPDVEKEVFFYLAKAYHLNYRFDDAIKQYQAYQKIASGPKAEKLQVARQIEMCKNGKKLLRNISDLIVIDKKEMSRTDFYRSYDITAIGGKLLAKPDEETFKTPIDKKKKESSIIYFSSDNNQIYFASYGDDVTHGKDIYLVRKLPNGELSKPQTLGYPVNTEYDEDFPFLHPNGKVLYFCSKGHNSMGGYDIFKTTLNELTNTWNKPVNLDFPINSPDDDILYITNADEKEAYFSSARSSATGKTAVYHINVERKPMDVAIVSGKILKSSPDQDMNVKITVKNLDDNTILGIFNANAETGDFTMNLPGGGKVMYTVESPGFPTQSEVVTIPNQTSLTPLKQEIAFEPGTGKLSVKNHFEEQGGDENYLSAINLIKEKSKMEVNVNDVATDNPSKTNTDETTAGTKPAGSKTGTKPANLSNDEIVKIAYADAKDVEKEAKELKDQADIALVIANQKNEEAQNKNREAAQLRADAAQMTDPAKKQTTLEQVNTANKEVGDLNQLTVTSYNVAKALEMKADAKQKEADLSLQYAKDLEAAVKSKSSTDALAKLDEQQKKLEAISQKNDASATISNSLKMDADNKKRELDKAIQTSADIKQEIADNETAITTTEADMAKEKNDNIKQGMKDQIQGLKDDIVTAKKELEGNEIKVAQLQKDYNGVNNQIELFNSVVDKAKTGNNESVNATAAAIDKTKLEQQVNTLKNADNTLASIKPITTETATETTSTTDKQTKTGTAKDNSQTPVVTNKTTTTPDITTTTGVDKNASGSQTPGVTNTTTQTPEVANTTGADKNTGTSQIPTDKTTQATGIEGTTTAASDKAFEDALAATASISDQTEKETKKAEVYENWSTAIQKELDEQKVSLQTETDPEKKTALTTSITALEKKLGDTQQLKTESLATVDKLKKEQTLAVNNGNETPTNTADNGTTNPVSKAEDSNNTNAVDRNVVKDNVSPTETSTTLVVANPQTTQQLTTLEETYKQEVTNAEQAPTEQEQETLKLKAAKNYVNAVTLAVNSKKSDLKAESDPAKQKDLNQDISVMEQNLAEKQKLADASNAKIAMISKTPGNTSTTPAVAGTKTGTTPAKEKVNPAEANTGTTTPTVKNIVDAKQQFTYSNTTAKTNLDKAASLDKEGDELITESKRIKEQAALQNDVNEKNAQFTKADELATSGELKKIEAAQLVGTANTTEYRNNKHAVDQYINANKGSADELAIADLMNDEAKTYFEKAQNSRKAATSFETNYAKQTALDDASKNEQIALQKQTSALAIYKKNNSKLVVRPLTAADIAATTPAKNKETSTTPGTTPSETTTTGTLTPTTTTGNTRTTTDDKTEKPQDVVAKEKVTTETPLVTPDQTKTTAEQPAENMVVTKDNEKPVSDVVINTDQPVKDKAVTTDQPLTNNTLTPPVTPTTKLETAKVTEQPIVTNKTTATTAGNTKSKTKFSFKELFEKRGKSKYSSSNPIPLDEKLPDGLVFKVQMGAFKNAIPQDLFQGISPVSGQTTSQGFIRYFAGLFLTCESAEKAKLIVRQLGFPDAFVVAYFDGKRIPPPCGTDGTTVATTATPETTLPQEKAVTPVQPPVTSEPVVTTPPVVKGKTEPVVSTSEIAPTTDVATLSGLFYTIQVGVYSKPITGVELNNIQPLYTENANNLIRYNVGIYNNIPLASEAKKIAVNGGLKDAFMTIYYNGKRISMAEAATLTAQGAATISSAPGLNQLPTFRSGSSTQNPSFKNSNSTGTTTPVQPSVNTTREPSTSNETPVVKPTVTPQPATTEIEAGIVFKVQIGAFNEEVPLETANKFLKISKKGIKNYKDEKGLTIYTVGKYATYEEADKARQEVAAEGLPDAFIVAYSDGKKIPVEEAQKLTGKQ